MSTGTLNRTGTVSSKPYSSRPLTSNTNRNDDIIVSMSEGRGCVPEIGIAGINLATTEAFLFQFSDTANFPLTFHILGMLTPKIIVMSETCIENQSTLYQAVEPFLNRRCDIYSMERSAYNEADGRKIMENYSIHV